MSHWTDIECKITDLKALESACRELGYEFITNENARGFGGQLMECDALIRAEGCRYDVAVVKKGEEYILKTDFWGGHIRKAFGKGEDNLGRLKEMYNVHKAEHICRARRMKFRRTTTDTHTRVEVYA